MLLILRKRSFNQDFRMNIRNIYHINYSWLVNKNKSQLHFCLTRNQRKFKQSWQIFDSGLGVSRAHLWFTLHIVPRIKKPPLFRWLVLSCVEVALSSRFSFKVLFQHQQKKQANINTVDVLFLLLFFLQFGQITAAQPSSTHFVKFKTLKYEDANWTDTRLWGFCVGRQLQQLVFAKLSAHAPDL